MSNLFISEKKDITRLVLVRHGRTQTNSQGRIGSVDDSPLDEKGIAQVHATAERLEQFDIDVIYSSPLLRTKQTTEIVASKLELPINYDPDLKEFEFGAVSNLTVEEIAEKLPDKFEEIQAWLESKPGLELKRPAIRGAEAIPDFISRIKRFCDQVIDSHPCEIVLVVTHMAVIKGVMAYITGAPLERHMNYNAENASITVIDFYKKNPVLVAFNDIAHLSSTYTFGRVNML